MASKEAALDSKLQSLSRDELIHFVKKQAAQVSKLKQNQLQQASTSDSPPKPKKGGTPVKPLDGQSNGSSSSGQSLSADVGQLVNQIEELTTCKETLEETLKNSGDVINQLRRENEGLKQEAECFAMQKTTFMASLQMFEDEKKTLVKDLSTMTEARDEALKCLELAKQAKAQTYRDSEIDLQKLLQERDDLNHLVNKLNKDLEYEKTLREDEKRFWEQEKSQLTEDLDKYKNQLETALEENEKCRVVIEDFTAKTCDLVEQLRYTKESLDVKAREYSIMEEKYNLLVDSSKTAIEAETSTETQEYTDSSVQIDVSQVLKSDAGSEVKSVDPGTYDMCSADPTESLKVEITNLKQQLLNVCNERAKLCEALKLTNQAKEETRAALETEKQMLSEKNFNLQTTNIYLTSKVMTMSKQLECIPEEQRSGPEEDVSMESIHSEDPANSSIANETPNKSFEGSSTSADVSSENVNNVEHQLASINIVIAQLEKEKDELCRKEFLIITKENQENIDQKEENTLPGSVLPAEPDLLSSCIPVNERTNEVKQESSGDDSAREAIVSCTKCEESNSMLTEIKEERDCLLSQIEALRTHETDLIDAQALLERRLEDLVSEKESIFLEVQGLIKDLNKYVSRNVDLENEKQRLSKLVTELGSSAEIVTVLKDSLQADKLILAEKDEQIQILENQVLVLKDSVGQYKSRYNELETILSEFESKFSEMERNTTELQEKNSGSEEERVKLSEQLEVSQEAIVRFHSELDYQKKEYGALKNRCEQMKQENDQLAEMLKTTEVERDRLRNEVLPKVEVVQDDKSVQKPEEVGQLSAEVVQQTEEVVQQTDEAEVAEVVKQSEVVVTDFTNAERFQKSQSEAKETWNQIEKVTVDVQTSDLFIQNLETELSSLKEKLYESQLQMKEKETEIASFKETSESLRSEKEKIEDSFDEEKRLLFEDLEKTKQILETTKSALANELSTKEENINVLNEEASVKDAEIEELRKKIQEWEAVANKLNETKVSHENKLTNLAEQKNILEDTLNKLESTSRNAKEKMSSEIEQLTNELSTKIQQTESLYDQIELLKNGASTELTRIVEEKQSLYSEMQRLNGQLESAHKEKSDILEKIKEDTKFMENEKETLTNQNMQLQEELSNRVNDMNELKDAITNLESSLSELEVQYERVRDEKREMSEKLTEVIDQSASEKLSLSEELQKLKSTSISRENSFSDLKTQHSDCSENIEHLTKQVETLQVEKNKLCGKFEDLEEVQMRELEKMQNEISRLQALNEEVKLQKNKVYDMYTALEENSVEKDKINAELNNRVSRLEQELENKKLKIETLAKDIQWHTENLDDMKNQVQQIFEENSTLKEKLSDVQLEKGNLGKELDNMKFQFEAFSQSDSRLRSNIAQLENVKIGIDHKYNLLSQEVDRFLTSFIDDVCDLFNVEQPAHEEISDLTQKMEFVDKNLKHTLSKFATGSKEMNMSKNCLEKRLDVSLKSLSNIGTLVLESENEGFEAEMEVKEIKMRSQNVESACQALLRDLGLLKEELSNRNKELKSKEEEIICQNQELNSKSDDLKVKTEVLISKDKTLESKNQEIISKDEELRFKSEELSSKIEELRDKNEELKYKDEELKSKDDKLFCRNEELKAKNEELDSKIEELKSLNEELNAKESSLRSLEQKLSGKVVSLSAQVKTEKETVEAKLNDSESKNQKLKQLVLKVKKDNQTLKTDMEKEQKKLSKLESELAGKTEECLSLQKIVLELQQRVQDLESNLNRSNEEKAYLEESIQTLQKDVETAGDVKYNLESDLESKKEEILRVKNDMIQALESEIGKTQQVVEDLQSDLEKLSQQKINMELEMTQRIEQKELEFSTEVEKLRAEKEDVEQEVEAKLKEIERMKEDHEEKIKEVESRNAQGENDKQAMLDLEMADMRRSLEGLKEKLETKSKQNDILSGQLETAKNERDALKKEKKDLDEKNAKYKQLLLKQKKELEELRKWESEWKKKELDFVQEVTSHEIEIENLKIQTASDAQSHVKLLEQISGLERRNVSLADLVKSLKEDLKQMEQRLETATAEFEHYKARVHTVFKQQKEKNSNVEDLKIVSAERDSMRTQLEYAKSQLSELGQDSEMFKLENERLQKECQNLSRANNQLTQQISQREISVQQKLDDLKFELEKKNNSFDVMESGYKNQICNLTKYYKDKLHSEEKEHREKLEKMEEELRAEQQQTKNQLLQKITVAEEPLQIITSPLTYSTPIQQPSGTVSNGKRSAQRPVIGRREPIGMERSEGDGVESDVNLFSSSTASFRASPKASQEFISFENLISPSKPPSLHSQGQQSFSFENTLEPMSPTDSSPISYSKRKTSAEMLNSASSSWSSSQQELKKQHKKVAHLTSLLNESEMNIQRLTDQSQLLKDEIRRLEGSWDETAKNMEYLKNILIKFFKLPNGKEKEQLVPVLTMLLKLSSDEKSLIAQLSSDASSGSESVPAVSGWSSYMPRWSGLM